MQFLRTDYNGRKSCIKMTLIDVVLLIVSQSRQYYVQF